MELKTTIHKDETGSMMTLSFCGSITEPTQNELIIDELVDRFGWSGYKRGPDGNVYKECNKSMYRFRFNTDKFYHEKQIDGAWDSFYECEYKDVERSKRV